MARVLRSWAAVLPRVIDRFLRFHGPQHGAAMAFFALLALVPGVLLLASTLAGILMEVPVDRALSPLDQILNGLELALPAFKGSVRSAVVDLAQTQPSMTWVSGISLLLAAGGAFAATERGINLMLGTEKRRHFVVTRLLLAATLLALALGLFLWRIFTSFAPRILSALQIDFPTWLLTNPLVELSLQIGVTAVGFYVLVRVIATERFGRLSRWSGALAFAALFHAARLGLDIFLSTTPLQQIYGTFMALVGLILWLYVVSLLILLCSSLIHAVEQAAQGR